MYITLISFECNPISGFLTYIYTNIYVYLDECKIKKKNEEINSSYFTLNITYNTHVATCCEPEVIRQHPHK